MDELLAEMLGEWRGRWKTWVEPGELYDDSPIAARVEVAVTPTIQINYRASIRDDLVTGVAVLGPTQSGGHLTWLDSWHTSGMIQAAPALLGDRAVVAEFTYMYEAEHWKWTSSFGLDDDDLTMRHFNEGPGYPRYLGVEATLHRA